MNSGHWMGLSIHPERREIYYFSTYGGKPDIEKNKWLARDDRIRSDQYVDVFNDGLKQLQQQGWAIHYNDQHYQKPGDATATCGIYTAAFLRSGLNPDEFAELTRRLKSQLHGEDPAIIYYNQFFV